MKVVTYLIGSPDEVAITLTDERNRHLWDPNIKAVVKKGEDTI